MMGRVSFVRIGLAAGLAGFMAVTALGSAAAATGPAAHARRTAASSMYGGVLTYVVSPNGPFIDNFNPWSPSNPAITGIFTEVYEPLFYYNQYTGQSIPKLATSYSYANGHKTLIIHLRKGVRWSDGKPFTSADVAFTLHMLATTPSIDYNGLSSMIQSVATHGPLQVIVHLKSPNSLAWYYIGENTPIVAQHVYGKVKNPATFKDAHPVTTGPFVLKSISNSLIVFKRNPLYWDHGKPYVSAIQMPLYLDNNTAAMAMAGGHFDAATNFVPTIQTTLLNRNPQHFHYWFPPIGSVVLETNDAVYPTSLVSFRKALSLAIDRQKVAMLGEFGYEPVANSVGLPSDRANQTYIDKAVLAHNPLSYNPNAARAILRKAGFKWNKAGQLIDPKGKAVSLTIDVGSGITDWIADAGVVARNLQAIGINAQVKTPSGATVSSALANGSFQLAMNWVNQAPAYIGYNTLLNGAFTARVGQPALSNFERWNNPQTNRLLTQYPKVFGVTQQKAVMGKLESIFAANLPVIPLLDGVAWEEYNTSNFVGWPSAASPYASFAGAIDDMYIFASVHKP